MPKRNSKLLINPASDNFGLFGFLLANMASLQTRENIFALVMTEDFRDISSNKFIIELEYLKPNYDSKLLAMFDLDGTLIKFSRDQKTKYTLLNDQVKPHLRDLVKNGYIVVIVTNQNVLSRNGTVDIFKAKMQAFFKELEIPIYLIGSLLHSRYRKPANGMFVHLLGKLSLTRANINDSLNILTMEPCKEENDSRKRVEFVYKKVGEENSRIALSGTEKEIMQNSHTISESKKNDCTHQKITGCSIRDLSDKFTSRFYVGDSAGRKNDYSNADLGFAINSFVPLYLPEEFFCRNKNYTGVGNNVKTDTLSGGTTESCEFPLPVNHLGESDRIQTRKSNYDEIIRIISEKKKIILIGPKFTGKRTFAVRYCKNKVVEINPPIKQLKTFNRKTTAVLVFKEDTNVMSQLKNLHTLSEEKENNAFKCGVYRSKNLDLVPDDMKHVVEFNWESDDFLGIKKEIASLHL